MSDPNNPCTIDTCHVMELASECCAILSSSDSSEDAAYDGISDVGFVNILKKHPIVFSKSQTTDTRKEKAKAITSIRERFLKLYGKDMTEHQIMKKLNNMKTRLRKKTDINVNNKKNCALNEWQRLLHDVIQGDTIPTLQETSSDTSPVLVPPSQISDVDRDGSDEATEQEIPDNYTFSTARSPSALEELETDETRNLTNEQLQRLILLEQLNVWRLKKERVSRARAFAKKRLYKSMNYN